MTKNMTKKKQEYVRRAITALLTVCMLFCQAIPAMADEAKATTMRLSKTEGTVSVSNHNGKTISLIKEMKLYDGYHVKTEESSYAWIALDDTKAVKLDAVSEVEVQQKGKKLELLLNSGSLFFNVTAPLEEDEVLNIRTSTMVTGIRGTSGIVRVVDDMHTRIVILDGQAQCRVTDPVTGQIKEAVIPGGQTADLYVYEKQHQGGKCDIIMHQAAEAEVDGFAALEIAKSPELQYRIKEASALEVDQVVRTAAQKLQQDQAKVWQQMKDIRYAANVQDQGQTLNSVFGEKPINQENSNRYDSDSDDDRNDISASVTRPTESQAPEETTPSNGSGGTGTGGSNGTDNGAADESTEEEPTEESTAEDETTAPADTVTFTMPVTAAEIQKALQTANKVTVNPSADSSQNSLSIDTDVQVPAGKTLEIGSGIQATVESGVTLQIDGTLDTAGNVTNKGTINNTSVNTFIVAGDLTNAGTLDNSGRLKLSNTMLNTGTLVNSGSIEGTVSSESGAFTAAGGTLDAAEVSGGSMKIQAGIVGNVTVCGGDVKILDGTVTDGVEVLDAGKFTIEGGTVLAGTAEQAVLNSGAGAQTVLLGGIVDGEEKTAVSVVSGDVEITTKDGVVVKAAKREDLLVIGTADGGESADGTGQASQNVKVNQVPWDSMLCQVVSWQDGKAVLSPANGSSVAEALETAAAGDEIVILRDCNLTEKADGTFECYGEVIVKNGTAQNPIVLDLNGKEFYVVSQSGFSLLEHISLSIAESGALKICDTDEGKAGKFIMGGDADTGGQAVSVEEDGFEEDRVRMLITGYITNYGDLTIEGCEVIYEALVIQRDGNLTVSEGARILPSEKLNTDDGAIWMVGGGFTVEGDDTVICSSGSMGTIHFESGFEDYGEIRLKGGTICNDPAFSTAQEKEPGPAFSWEKASEDGTGKVTAEELNKKFPKEILTVIKGKNRELFAIGEGFDEENPYAPMGYQIADAADGEGYYHLVKLEEGKKVVTNLTVNVSPAAFQNALATSDQVVISPVAGDKWYFAIENMELEIPEGTELVVSSNVILQIKENTTFVVKGTLTCEEEIRAEGTVEVAEGAVVNSSVLVADNGNLTVNGGKVAKGVHMGTDTVPCRGTFKMTGGTLLASETDGCALYVNCDSEEGTANVTLSGGTIDGGENAYAIKMEQGSLTIEDSMVVTSGYSQGTVWFAGVDGISVQFEGGDIYNKNKPGPVLVWETGANDTVGEWLSIGIIETEIKGKDAYLVKIADEETIPEGYSVTYSNKTGYFSLIKTASADTAAAASVSLLTKEDLLPAASPSNAASDSTDTDLPDILEEDQTLPQNPIPPATPGNAESQESIPPGEQGEEAAQQEEEEPDSSSVPGAQWVHVPQTESDTTKNDDREDGEE